ncbi:MAG: NAD(P)/FAD-dependent oxidoreductase [Elusimicrobiota bacterium]|jgi:predicted Rossmann fold flavoprotein|nr:NAD(P)/FAD-dependent oxidoreductase [Elusimicrobiota bacterium]
MRDTFNTAILGAGASGLMCGVLLPNVDKIIIEAGKTPGAKILASGGGLCNFSNIKVSKADYFGQNIPFCLSALAGYKPQDFINFLNSNHTPYTQRSSGQLFAKSSKNVLEALLNNINKQNTQFAFNTFVKEVIKRGEVFEIQTSKGSFFAKNVICALGGLSYPALGATDGAYKIAKSFGLDITPLYPALTGIIFQDNLRQIFTSLAGVSFNAKLTCGKNSFEGSVLITHAGISGPPMFQLSLYGVKNKEIKIDFLPTLDLKTLILAARSTSKKVSDILKGQLPPRLINALLNGKDKQVANLSNKESEELIKTFHNFTFIPKDTNGYDHAEITAGGIETKNISSKTMQVAETTGLYFTGECLDISGRLGGYNLHWAWASAAAAARHINATAQNK